MSLTDEQFAALANGQAEIMRQAVATDTKVAGMLTAVEEILRQVQPAVDMISTNPIFSMLLGKKKSHE